MRTLLLLRGSPGCGKTTWIENNGLRQYALSADDIRLMCSSPQMRPDGTVGIDQSKDKEVWNILFRMLEIRMKYGEFTVIDATNSKSSEMNKYKQLCEAYRYRIYCVDFTDIPMNEAKKRNRQRPQFKIVPDSAIDKMYSRFQTQKIPSGITVIKPDELDKVWRQPIDLSQYKTIHHIGDIHGCYTPLLEYFEQNGGLKDDEFYIFVGDYVDRGLENLDVIRFLLSIYQKKNVMLLEGNHEKWLWIWANNGNCPSKEFELHTKCQLENGGIEKKEVRKLYRKMIQCAFYKYYDKTFLVTHGGLSTFPDNLTLVPTSQMINGVGNYNDVYLSDEVFAETTRDVLTFQVHGHRNPRHDKFLAYQNKVFNLEGQVEFGGYLRCIQVSQQGNIELFEIKNDIFRQEEVPVSANIKTGLDVGDVILSLRESRFIQEKKFGDISSFNFTKKAFYDKVWNEQTVKARGLYINIPKQKVVARAYEKFFNINERPETKLEMLKHRLSFPITAYVKENGFLGIVSYNEENDSLFVTTKSSPTGDYSGWLKDIIYSKLSEGTIDEIKQFSKDNNVSFVFECVDMKNDPHIIEYGDNELFLLDIVCNKIEFEKYDYFKMAEIADNLGLKHKELAYVIEDWSDFYEWYFNVKDEDYEYNGRKIEGFVLEDSCGYMVKMKLAYYNCWKFLRSISCKAIKSGQITPEMASSLTSAEDNIYCDWVKKLHNTEDLDSVPKDICTLRKLFYESDEWKKFKGN